MKTKAKTKTEKSKAKTVPTTAPDKPTLVAFLLDRTGSMSGCRDETISGFNGYIDELMKSDKGIMRFTLTQFDSIAVENVHNIVPLAQVNRLTTETYVPRANTPLYDAIGKTIRATEKDAGDKYKVLFVTLTDGQENASSEWNEQTAKALIKDKEENSKWTFAYIGVGLAGFGATSRIAAGTIGASNVMQSSHKNTGKAYAMMARSTTDYAANSGAGGQSVSCVFGTDKPTTEK